MSLNTLAEVGKLVPELDSALLQPFLDAASLVVSELGDKGLSSARLKLIEAYVAGHFSRVSYNEKISQKIGDASETYAKAKSGLGFAETALGRQAISLDTSGTLADQGGKAGYFSLLSE